MPRIRKQQFGGAPGKLETCFNALLSGASGECMTGELGCCGDSCCSSAVVSRALAEYCQHSPAARTAFAAAKGIEAMQVALTRGSPSVAAAAARVLGALCGSPHGLRSILQWQRSSGRDLLCVLAGAAGGGGLPPELRAECVDALRAALGSLHGPAAGGGMELASALQAPSGGIATGWDGAFSLAASGGVAAPGDLIASVALPPLLSANLHLRAAAARLVAAAAEEGLLPGGAAAAAATLAAALGLTVAGGAGAADGLEAPPGGTAVSPAEASDGMARAEPCWDGACVGSGAAAPAAVGVAGSQLEPGALVRREDAGTGTQEGRRADRVLALCELVVALLSSALAVELLETMRAPQQVLQLCGEAIRTRSEGRRPEREALLDAVLVCLREGAGKLWKAGDDGSQRDRRAFTGGAADLASQLLVVAGCGGGQPPVSERLGLVSTAAALGAALAAWPQVLLHHPDVSPRAAALLGRLCDMAASLLRLQVRTQAPKPAVGDGVTEPALAAELGPSPWVTAASTQSAPVQEAAAVRVAAGSCAAAVRLYGALYGTSDAADRACGSGHLGGEELRERLVECLRQLTEAGRGCSLRTAVALLAEPLAALVDASTEILRSLVALNPAPTDPGREDRAGFLYDLGLAAAALAGDLMTGRTTSPPRAPGGAVSLWGGDDHSGNSRRHPVNTVRAMPVAALGAEEHAALLSALRVWAMVMEMVPTCECTADVTPLVPDCRACVVRPSSFLEAAAAAAEALLRDYHQASTSGGDSTGDPTCGSNRTQEALSAVVGVDDGDAQGFRFPELARPDAMAADMEGGLEPGGKCATDRSSLGRGQVRTSPQAGPSSLSNRGAQLLTALTDTLAAAIGEVHRRPNPGFCPDPPPSISGQLHVRIQQLVLMSPSRRRPRSDQSQHEGEVLSVGLAVGLLASASGKVDSGDVATDDMLAAEELADAEAILDDCLSCVRVGNAA